MSEFNELIRLDVGPLEGDAADNLLAPISSFDSKPSLRLTTKHGVFLWGSDRLAQWVHHDDLAFAQETVPGYRVFRREPCPNENDREQGYATFYYGDRSFRGLPIIWLEIPSEGLQVGDCVEIKSDYGKRQPGLGHITDVTWNRYQKKIEYTLRMGELTGQRVCAAAELRRLTEKGTFLKAVNSRPSKRQRPKFIEDVPQLADPV